MAGRGLALNGGLERCPWKIGIVTTIFWIGERPTTNNPVPNDRSSWDPNWFSNYGGYDDPNSKSRKDFKWRSIEELKAESETRSIPPSFTIAY
jgi:hypothetical protein